MGRKQHFVPQFLLRNFASDPERRRISLFYLPKSKVIRGASIKDQAYKKNLYGSDQNIETYLTTVETEASVIIDKIIRTESISLKPEEEITLKHFINLQRARTPQEIAKMQTQVDKWVKIMFRHDPRFKDHLDDFDIRLTSPYHFMIAMALDITPVLFDLKVSLLKNGSAECIFIGEHPAIVTNPFLHSKKWPASLQGLGVKGTLVLLPISDRHVLALYDRRRYGLRNFERVGTLSEGDVLKLNAFQFCYTADCIYFYDSGNKINFGEYRKRTKKFRAGEKRIIQALQGIGEERTKSELVWSTSKEPPVEPKFDFIDATLFAFEERLGPTMDISREEAEWALSLHEKGGFVLPL